MNSDRFDLGFFGGEGVYFLVEFFGVWGFFFYFSRMLFLTKLFALNLKSSWELEISQLGLIDFASHA